MLSYYLGDQLNVSVKFEQPQFFLAVSEVLASNGSDDFPVEDGLVFFRFNVLWLIVYWF